MQKSTRNDYFSLFVDQSFKKIDELNLLHLHHRFDHVLSQRISNFTTMSLPEALELI
jgi:hypothetical protein